MQNLTSISATKLALLIKNKKVSCVEVMQAHLNRIAEVNPKLNAVIQQLSAEQALQQAKAADEAINKKQSLGKLHGIPVVIKDGYKVTDFICSTGCKSSFNHKPAEDATFVSRLRQEGAIILGLTNIPELMLAFETDNLLYGRTNNPYNLDHTSGGSSGGSAAIIAAGGCALGSGSDGAGSIRVPAHNCGIAGIKPTRGLVPATGFFPEDGIGLFNFVAYIGPLARHVEDLNLGLSIMAGSDQRDPFVVAPVQLKNPDNVDLKTLRVAYYIDNLIVTPTEDTIQTIQQTVKELTPFVNNITEVSPKTLTNVYELLFETFFLGCDKGEGVLNFLRDQNATPSPLLQTTLALAEKCNLSVTEFRNRFVMIENFCRETMRLFQDYDVIICPVVATPAKLHGESVAQIRDFTYTMNANLTGWPAGTVRCGTSKQGLPIGVQIIAKPWRDDVVLAVAKRLEEIFGGWQASNI